jgi:hypothetical protein
MISTVINNTTPPNEKQKIKYRSFKNMDVMALNEDLSKVNMQVQSSTNEIDVNEIYVTFRCIFLGNNFFQIFFLAYLLNFFLTCSVPSF